MVEYAFLSDFDLLRDARQDIRRKPWATPAARLAIDQAFKLERAEEEITRLNIEVPRLATYLRDEDTYLRAKEAELALSNPSLAHQVSIHRMERGRFNAHHLKVLEKIHHLTGYTGPIEFGTHIAEIATMQEAAQAPFPSQAPTCAIPCLVDLEEDLEEEQAGEDEDVVALGALLNVLDVMFDA